MQPARPVLAALLLLTACTAETPAPVPTTTTAASTAGSCSEVVRDGARVTDDLIDKGCTDSGGTTRVGKVTTCKDGTRLWEMDGLIGLSGDVMVPEQEQADGIPARMLYQRACTG